MFFDAIAIFAPSYSFCYDIKAQLKIASFP